MFGVLLIKMALLEFALRNFGSFCKLNKMKASDRRPPIFSGNIDEINKTGLGKPERYNSVRVESYITF